MSETAYQEPDLLDGLPAPRETLHAFGLTESEQILLSAYQSGRMHHAWLLNGLKGIGKATLAFRFARFIMAYPDPFAPDVQNATSLDLPEGDPTASKVAAGGHPNILHLHRPWDEKAKRFKTVLTVDEVRRTTRFFGQTAGESGWRIAIVDSADEFNTSAANAILKILEEPPQRTLFLMISHLPGRLLPTIRSRCRRLNLAPLSDEALLEALNAYDLTGHASGHDVQLAANLSDGSLRRAMEMLASGGIDIYRAMLDLLANLPNLDGAALHNFAEKVSAAADKQHYILFFDLLEDWIARRIRMESEPGLPAGDATQFDTQQSLHMLATWTKVWEKIANNLRLAESLNLDRKQVILQAFADLAGATRSTR